MKKRLVQRVQLLVFGQMELRGRIWARRIRLLVVFHMILFQFDGDTIMYAKAYFEYSAQMELIAFNSAVRSTRLS